MRKLTLALIALGMGMFAATTAWGGSTVNIEVSDANGGRFLPKVAEQTVGFGGVAWSWSTEDGHNVRQDRKLFYSGSTDTTDDLTLNEISAGTFPYYCVAHGGPGTGMSGTVEISPIESSTKRKHGDFVFGAQWATDALQTGDQFDVQYKVGNGDWKSWKKNTAAIEGVFGSNDNPVDVKPDKLYRVRARSEDSNRPKRKSGFSPALRLEVQS